VFHGWEAEGEDPREIAWLDWDDLTRFLVLGQHHE
jgi:hypothetical protein